MGTVKSPLKSRIMKERPAPARNVNRTTVADLISGPKTPRATGGILASRQASRAELRAKESKQKAQMDFWVGEGKGEVASSSPKKDTPTKLNGPGRRRSFLTKLDQMGVIPLVGKPSYQGTTVGFLLDEESKPPTQTKFAPRKSRTEDFEKVKQDRASPAGGNGKKTQALRPDDTPGTPSITVPSDVHTTTTDGSSSGHLTSEADFGRPLSPKMFKNSLKTTSMRFNPDDDVFQIIPVGEEAPTKDPRSAGGPSRTRVYYEEDPFKPSEPPHPTERWYTYATKDYSLPDPYDIPKTNQLHGALPPITPPITPSCVARDPNLPYNNRLTDVKHSLYNPGIKSFRVLQDDDRFGGICGENLRHTTDATAEDFALAEAGIYKPPTRAARQPPNMCPSMCRRMNKDRDFEHANDVWRKFLDAPTCIPPGRPEAENFLFKDAADRLKYFRFENQMVKFGKRSTEAAKFVLKSEPSLENYQQRPLPQDVLRRYR